MPLLLMDEAESQCSCFSPTEIKRGHGSVLRLTRDDVCKVSGSTREGEKGEEEGGIGRGICGIDVVSILRSQSKTGAGSEVNYLL
jgi:hypothetical protein